MLSPRKLAKMRPRRDIMANCEDYHNSACAGFTGTTPHVGTPPSFCWENTLSRILCCFPLELGLRSRPRNMKRPHSARPLSMLSVVNGRLRSPTHYGLFRMPVFQNASLPRRGISWGESHCFSADRLVIKNYKSPNIAPEPYLCPLSVRNQKVGACTAWVRTRSGN